MTEVAKEKFQIRGYNYFNCNKKYGNNVIQNKSIKEKFLKNKVAVISSVILVLIIIMTIIGPSLSKYNYFQIDKNVVNMKPSLEHWFGTDSAGADIFDGVWIAGRTSLLIGVFGALINLTIGIIFGGISGYYGGIIDDIFMSVLGILACIPNVLMVLFILLIIGRSIPGLIVGLSINGWCYVASITRGQVLQIKEQEYILAASALGAGTSRIISKHLIRNLINIIIVTISFEIPSVMLNEGILTFMGFGVCFPEISWALMARFGLNNIMFYPFQILIPCLFMSLTMLCFNLLGEALSSILDVTIDDTSKR